MEQISLDRQTGIIAFARAASLGSYTAASRVLDNLFPELQGVGT